MARRSPSALVGVVVVLLAACAAPGATGSAPLASVGPATAAPAGTASPATRVVTITSTDVPPPAPQQPMLAADAPRRIVSLATGVGETLAALGVADRVVGRDETSDVPAIDGAPVMTKAHATNAEKVLSVDPDVVIVDAATSPPEALDQIRAAGVPVVEVPEAWTLDDIATRTMAVARAVGVPDDVASAVVAEATSGDASVTSDAAGPTVAFLYLRGTSAIYLLGGRGSGADALISAAGGTDVGAAADLGAFVPLTAEALAAADPDILLVMTKGLESVGGVDGLVALPGVAQTTAGRERRVVAVDDTLLLSFGPRTGALVSALREAFAQVSA